MAEKTYLQAISDGLRQEMRRDPRVFVLGEDVGVYGGAFKVTLGFQEEFGPWRVIDMPLSETAIVAGATGAALMGLRPVAEMQFADFVSCAWDHLVTVAAKQRYRAGTPIPIVLRLPSGGGFSGGPFHSQNPESSFAHIPGLKIVCPATPEDAKGLLVSAIEDPNPVLFFEHKHLYRRIKGEVPGRALHDSVRQGPHPPCGRRHHGGHVGSDGLHRRRGGGEARAGRRLRRDPRPAHADPLGSRGGARRASSKCSKVLVLHEDTRTGGFGAEIAATIAEEAFEHLDAPGQAHRGARLPGAVLAAAREGIHSPGRRRRRRAPRAGGVLGGGSRVATGTQTEVVMPQMGVSVSEGTVTKWLKQVGDTVALDEPLLEISTDKVDTEVPSPGEGIVAQILVDEGATVEVGTVLAVIAPRQPPRPEPPEPAAPAPSRDSTTELPPSRAEPSRPPSSACLQPPSRRHGPARAAGAPAAGEQRQDVRLAGRGADRRGARRRPEPRPGNRHRRPRDEEGHPRLHRVRRSRRARARGSEPPTSPSPPPSPRPPTAVAAPAGLAPPCRLAAAPPPPPRTSGPLRAAPSPSRAAAAEPGEIDGADDGDAPRRDGAHAPLARHLGARDERDRGRHVEGGRDPRATEGRVPEELRRQPDLSRLRRPGDRRHAEGLPVGERRDPRRVDRHAPVRQPRHRGRARGRKGPDRARSSSTPRISTCSAWPAQIADIAERARTKKLLPDDVQGGTFTITNPGGFGTFHGTPIISQPQVGILGTYALVKRPWVVQDELGHDVIAIRPMMNITLTYDHRLVDGAYSGQFLRDLRERLESWTRARTERPLRAQATTHLATLLT